MLKKPLTKKEFVKKASVKHNNKYTYDKVIYTNQKSIVTITCPIHGDFEQKANSHLNGFGCPTCGGTKKSNKEEFIKKSKSVHGNKYTYKNVVYINNRTCVKITCPIHGDFLQIPNSHLLGNGCPECSKYKKPTHSQFVDKANAKHNGFYEYPMCDYVDSHSKILIRCPIHGDFYQRPADHINDGNGCPKCFGSVSALESELVNFINSTGTTNVITSERSVIPPYELDIYLPDQNLAIEFDGLYWHSTAVKKDRKYHLRKTQMCEEKGIRLIHIYEDEWRDRKDRVKDAIQNVLKCGMSTNVSARMCSVFNVNKNQAKDFLNINHIQGYTGSSVRIGLFINDTLVAYMGFTKQQNVYNLNRFATSGNVRGGFSKLLSHFRKNYSYKSIISYADRRWSQGGVYETNGFRRSHTSTPSFDYVKQGVRYNRQQFMKKYLSKKFPDTYDLSLTEWENMELQGYYQIWNCGYIKYVMDKEYER